jgi:hypothetical protein
MAIEPPSASAISQARTRIPSTSPPGTLAAWLATAFVSGLILAIPFGGSPGAGLLLPATLAGVVAILAARLDKSDRWCEVTLWPPILFLGMTCLSIATSELQAIAIRRSATMPIYATGFVLVQVAAWHRPALGVIFASAFIALAGLGLDAMVESATGSPLFTALDVQRLGRISGSQGNPNDFAASAILMPLAVAFWGRDRRTMGIVITALIAVPCWAITASRQALLGWIAAIVSVAPGRLRGPRTWLIAGSVMVGVLVLILAIPTTRDRLTQTFEGDLSGRPGLLAFGCSLLADHPLTGIGPGVFGEYYVDAVATNWTWNGQPLRQYGVPWVHNLPLELALELGLPGFMATGLIIVASIRRVIAGARREDPAWSTITLAAGGGIAVWLVIGQVDLTLIKDWFRCLFWVTLGLAFTIPGQQRDSMEDA